MKGPAFVYGIPVIPFHVFRLERCVYITVRLFDKKNSIVLSATKKESEAKTSSTSSNQVFKLTD
jgi:hypothetical protein